MKIENTEGYMTDGEPEYMYVEFDVDRVNWAK